MRWREYPLLVMAAGMMPLTVEAAAQHLAVKHYTAADGLPSNEVSCIPRDLRGYLWFCITEGLARFDGRQFQTFGVRDGLPSPAVNDFLQSRDGSCWIGTANGLCRFEPSWHVRLGVPRFACRTVMDTDRGQPLPGAS